MIPEPTRRALAQGGWPGVAGLCAYAVLTLAWSLYTHAWVAVIFAASMTIGTAGLTLQLRDYGRGRPWVSRGSRRRTSDESSPHSS